MPCPAAKAASFRNDRSFRWTVFIPIAYCSRIGGRGVASADTCQGWVELKNDEAVSKGIKLFHIDLNSMRLEVSESWNGAETAHLALPLPTTYS